MSLLCSPRSATPTPRHATQPRQKEAALPEHLIAMLETLPRGTFWGLRDRAMLLIGFAGGLRRSEIVGLDVGRDQTKESRGWVEILDKGMVVTVRGKRGWRSGNRPRLVGRHLPDRDAADLAQPCEDRARPPVPAGDRSRQGCWPRTAAGSESGAPRQEGGTGCRRATRPYRNRACGKVLRPLAARRPGLLGRGRGALSAEATRSRIRRDGRKYQRRRDRFRVNLTKASGL